MLTMIEYELKCVRYVIGGLHFPDSSCFMFFVKK